MGGCPITGLNHTIKNHHTIIFQVFWRLTLKMINLRLLLPLNNINIVLIKALDGKHE
jgi:hypothetical protein